MHFGPHAQQQLGKPNLLVANSSRRPGRLPSPVLEAQQPFEALGDPCCSKHFDFRHHRPSQEVFITSRISSRCWETLRLAIYRWQNRRQNHRHQTTPAQVLVHFLSPCTVTSHAINTAELGLVGKVLILIACAWIWASSKTGDRL